MAHSMCLESQVSNPFLFQDNHILYISYRSRRPGYIKQLQNPVASSVSPLNPKRKDSIQPLGRVTEYLDDNR